MQWSLKKRLGGNAAHRAEEVVSLPLLIRISQELGLRISLLVDFSDADTSERDTLAQLEEMRAMFQEMKQMNKELDRLLAEMDALDEE